jgi:glutamate synthase domain-containing protein 3
LAKTVLNFWPEAIKHFVQVVPEEYRLALLQIEQDNQLKEVG